MRRAVLAAAIAGCLAASAWVPAAPAGEATAADRDREGPAGRRAERGPYLGVAATPAPAVLRRHVGLPAGVGLVLDAVAPDSPAAAAGLKPDDLLHKLNDQVLVNPHQLAVLVRTFKPGDAVRLTVVRDGKPTELSATLAERELPPLDQLRFGPPAGFPFAEPREEVGRGGPGDGPFDGARPFPPGFLGENATVSWDDGEVHIDLTIKAGRKHLSARDKAGKPLCDGPVDTDEQVAALPPAVRDRLPHVGPPGLFKAGKGGPADGPAGRGPESRPSGGVPK